MKPLLLALLLVSAVAAQPVNQNKTPPRKLVEVVQCLKVPTEKEKHTGLNCGVDEKGEELILDVPETWYQFPIGDVFKLYFFSDGSFEVPVDHQPKGSRVIKSLPCKKIVREAIQPLNAGPCNPELTPS